MLIMESGKRFLKCHQTEMKEKVRKEFLKRTRKLLKIKLCSRNLVKEINTWTAPPCKILGTILKMDTGRTLINGPEDKNVDDTQSLTSET